MDIVGWVGSFLFAICAIPQAWASYRQGHSNGMTHSLLWLWAGGEVLTLMYVLHRQEWPLILNYVCNLLALIVIVWFKYRPRSSATA